MSLPRDIWLPFAWAFAYGLGVGAAYAWRYTHIVKKALERRSWRVGHH